MRWQWIACDDMSDGISDIVEPSASAMVHQLLHLLQVPATNPADKDLQQKDFAPEER
jgi:hypothetical protein